MKSKNFKKVVGGIIASIVLVMFAWMAAATDVIPPGQPDGIGIESVSGDNPPTTSFTWTGSGDVVVDVVAHNYENDPSGTFIISGIPVGSNIIQAYMYATEWEFSSGEVTSGTFDGISLSAVSPISSDSGGGLYLATYRWDVTTFVTGDGSYSFTTSGLERSFGSALVVVYQNPSEPSREIIINDGAESIDSATSTTTFSGVSPGSSKLLLFTEADNAGGNSESVTFNGIVVAGPGDIFHANQGPYATLLNIPVTTVSGINTASVYSDGDSLFGWELAILSTEVRSIEKMMSPTEGELGDVVHVTLTVGNEPGHTVTVVDTLPSDFSYITGTFTVDGVPATPTVIKSEISYTINDPGTYMIEFDVKVDSAYWEDREVCNVATATWYDETGIIVDEMEVSECFIIHAFEELHKNVGIPKADVVFAIDLTGSMWDEIEEVKDNAENIMNSLAAQIGDVQFGLISYMDYTGTYTTTEPGSVPETYTATYGWAPAGDYPYQLDQDITDDTSVMATKINALTLGSGGDGPQDYTRIIHESWNDPDLNWRTDAKRILILFGDNVPHDTDFDYNNDGTPDNTGGDPGPDTILGTDDDLDFETEVTNAAAADVHIMSVYSGWSPIRYPWEYMASETGGGYYELTEAGQIPEAIEDLIKAQAQETLTINEKTETQWAVVMDIINPFPYTMTNTIISDRFGAEIEMDEEVLVTHGTYDITTKGKSEKMFLNWNIGDLESGETARLILLVSTDLNPAGIQEYSSPGIYELNSGATLKFIDPEQDMQLSAVTDSIYVTVLD